MAFTAWSNKYQGGFCYAACQETFSFYNPSTIVCRKGCDFAVGRVNDEAGREEAQKMCKRFVAEYIWTKKGELDNIDDLRVHADMFPTTAEKAYKACLAGLRRQKF